MLRNKSKRNSIIKSKLNKSRRNKSRRNKSRRNKSRRNKSRRNKSRRSRRISRMNVVNCGSAEYISQECPSENNKQEFEDYIKRVEDLFIIELADTKDENGKLTDKKIKNTYKKMMIKIHPDKNLDCIDCATVKSKVMGKFGDLTKRRDIDLVDTIERLANIARQRQARPPQARPPQAREDAREAEAQRAREAEAQRAREAEAQRAREARAREARAREAEMRAREAEMRARDEENKKNDKNLQEREAKQRKTRQEKMHEQSEFEQEEQFLHSLWLETKRLEEIQRLRQKDEELLRRKREEWKDYELNSYKYWEDKIPGLASTSDLEEKRRIYREWEKEQQEKETPPPSRRESKNVFKLNLPVLMDEGDYYKSETGLLIKTFNKIKKPFNTRDTVVKSDFFEGVLIDPKSSIEEPIIVEDTMDFVDNLLRDVHIQSVLYNETLILPAEKLKKAAKIQKILVYKLLGRYFDNEDETEYIICKEKFDGTFNDFLMNNFKGINSDNMKEKFSNLSKAIYSIVSLLDVLQTYEGFIHGNLNCDNVMYKLSNGVYQFYLTDFRNSEIADNRRIPRERNSYNRYNDSIDMGMFLESVIENVSTDVWDWNRETAKKLATRFAKIVLQLPNIQDLNILKKYRAESNFYPESFLRYTDDLFGFYSDTLPSLSEVRKVNIYYHSKLLDFVKRYY